MKRRVGVLGGLVLVGALVAFAVSPGWSQFQQLLVNTINPAITTQSQYIGPSGSSGLTIGTSGELSQGTAHTDGGVFITAIEACRADSTNLTPTRVAASDWALARTASGGEVFNITCSLNSWLERVGGLKGIRITSIAIAHQITVQALNQATWGKVATVVHANNTANTIGSDLATPPTLPTATQANPYLTSVAIATPAYLPGSPNTNLSVEWSISMANTGVYRLYGLWVNYSRLDH